jgi:hypothetical protein
VIDKKQTMLVRLFSRDAVGDILMRKKDLKGSTTILYEDASVLDRVLVTDLKKPTEINQAWISSGKVWAKLSENGKKYKFSILDNIEHRISYIKRKSSKKQTPSINSPTPSAEPTDAEDPEETLQKRTINSSPTGSAVNNSLSLDAH